MSESSTVKSSILLIGDALRPNMLGPYGNTWFDTPFVNQLASESLLFENCISDTPDAALGLRSILRGQHSCDQPDREEHLIDRVGASGAESVLVTDNPGRIAAAPDMFDRIVEVQLPDPTALAADIESTQLATFFATAIEIVQQINNPTMLILDCSGFSNVWDAPYAIRKKLSDADDPDPSSILQPPKLQFNPATDDPDQLLDFQTAYGSQVVLFDQLLGILLGQLAQVDWAREAMFCLTATRGYPLGEHGVVGYYRQILHTESVHVPLLIRWPGHSKIFGRSQQLVQPGSLYRLLSDWHLADNDMKSTLPEISATQLMPTNDTSAVISKCSIEGADHFAIQTHAWKFLSGPAKKLFVKPDDIWEFNDVADLCPQIVDDLSNQLEFGVQMLNHGSLPEFQLNDELAYGIE